MKILILLILGLLLLAYSPSTARWILKGLRVAVRFLPEILGAAIAFYVLGFFLSADPTGEIRKLGWLLALGAILIGAHFGRKFFNEFFRRN